MIQLFFRSRLIKTVLVAAFCIFAFCFQLAAQQNATQQTADALFADAKWAQAGPIYAQITAQEPANGAAWKNLGECYMQMGRFNDAQQAFSHAVQQNYQPVLNKINVARAQAARGETASSLIFLKEVAASGRASGLRGLIAGATEFQKLHANPEFQEILKSLVACQTPEFRQFDFWIGDWAVENPTGQKVGENLVTREQDGCILIEHWKSGRGFETGTSFNYYDIRDKKFHQIYFDNSGNAGAYPPMAGGLIDNKMVMVSDANASPVFRWTWYVISPGKVRQMAEQSNDGQKTWQIVWDSVYVNKAQQASK